MEKRREEDRREMEKRREEEKRIDNAGKKRQRRRRGEEQNAAEIWDRKYWSRGHKTLPGQEKKTIPVPETKARKAQ